MVTLFVETRLRVVLIAMFEINWIGVWKQSMRTCGLFCVCVPVYLMHQRVSHQSKSGGHTTKAVVDNFHGGAQAETIGHPRVADQGCCGSTSGPLSLIYLYRHWLLHHNHPHFVVFVFFKSSKKKLQISIINTHKWQITPQTTNCENFTLQLKHLDPDPWFLKEMQK